MKKFMFGLDPNDPQASARKLSALGYDAVVLPVGDPDAFAAAKDAGLEPWLCFGAHAIRAFSPKDHGARDAKGNPAPWFGSACPNSEEVNSRNLDAALNFAAKVDGIAGVFVDGARFASFASGEGLSSFFGCFCDRCMEKLTALGFDAQATKSGVSMLMDYVSGGEGDIQAMRAALEAWFDFRAACVKEYMAAFAQRTHAIGLKAGAFVFPPSLWWFVGQRPDSLTALDIVSPMLYRAYPHTIGTACLSHEWEGFRELLSHAARSAEDVASLLFDIAFPSEDPMKGFPPEHVGLETAAARAQLPARIALTPIIQTEDESLSETAAQALSRGADGYGEFMYTEKTFSD